MWECVEVRGARRGIQRSRELTVGVLLLCFAAVLALRCGVQAHIRKGAKGNEVVFYEIRSSRRVAPQTKDDDATSKLITDVAFKRSHERAATSARAVGGQSVVSQ